jgi:hypothetical protein
MITSADLGVNVFDDLLDAFVLLDEIDGPLRSDSSD